MKRPEPNQTLQRTRSAVTLAASCRRLSPTMQPARQLRESLSLGSFDEMKFAITGLILALIFVGTLLLRFDRERIGPYTADEKDDLEIKEAYFDNGRSKLYLIRGDTWAALDLAKVSQANRAFKYTIKPIDGNFLHFRDFESGRPSQSELSDAIPVPVLTGQFASFNYKWDGKARSGHKPPIELPDGSQGALYRSSSEVAANNKDWFKSLLFYTDSPWQDSRYGVQFFYHPDFRTTVTFQHPASLIFFGPSFVGLSIAAFACVSRVRLWVFLSLVAVALGLHGISFFLYLGAVRYGEAWSGYSSAHNHPYVFLGCGFGAAFLLLILHLVFWRNKSNNAVEPTPNAAAHG